MIPSDVLLAVVIVVVLLGLIFGLVLWARGGAPHDDGTGGAYRNVLPDPVDEAWAEPPSRVPAPLPRRGTPTDRKQPDERPHPDEERDRASGPRPR